VRIASPLPKDSLKNWFSILSFSKSFAALELSMTIMPTNNMKADNNDAIILILILENMQRFWPLISIDIKFQFISIYYNSSTFVSKKLNSLANFCVFAKYLAIDSTYQDGDARILQMPYKKYEH
jgi:hypothetical protein